MNIKVREFNESDIQAANEIWNEVVEDGVAFPQEECLTEKSGLEFFKSQSYTGIAYDEETGDIVGLYILHPNNVGRCGHICNASYAVKSTQRGKHIGEILVTDCLKKAKEIGYGVLQFNAVVATNQYALKLYKKLGFVQLGVIPNGFRMKDGTIRRYNSALSHFIKIFLKKVQPFGVLNCIISEGRGINDRRKVKNRRFI